MHVSDGITKKWKYLKVSNCDLGLANVFNPLQQVTTANPARGPAWECRYVSKV